MRSFPSPLICERVRTQISLLLDGEVSELDRRLVSAHLARCAECRAFEQPVRAFTEELRAAPLELPSLPVVVVRPVRTGQRVLRRTAELSAAATVLIAVGVVTQLGAAPSSEVRNGRLTTAGLFKPTAWQPEVELAQLDPAVRDRRPATGPAPLSAV
jgi:predicted anti-sigma-YlaC factor YlaD